MVAMIMLPLLTRQIRSLRSDNMFNFSAASFLLRFLVASSLIRRRALRSNNLWNERVGGGGGGGGRRGGGRRGMRGGEWD